MDTPFKMGCERAQEPIPGQAWMAWLLPGLLTLALAVGCFVPRGALAGDSLDIEKWLNRPGVRMLAVEFYATWCKPCMEAVPKWKKLHEKYRDKGLRLVVVAVQDPRGVCVNPGWDPDDVVCDLDGSVSTALGVGQTLPSALLWSWTGKLLVQNAHVGEVEKKIKEELNTLPRVIFDPEMKNKGLKKLLRAELNRSRKIEVVAGRKEKKALRKIQKSSHGLNFSQATQCKIGEELAPNSLLHGEVKKIGGRKKLLLSLFSAEAGCLSASAAVSWSRKEPDSSVSEAVSELLEGLKEEAMMPAAGGLTLIGERRETGTGAWVAKGTKKEIVAFSSKPDGAMVMLDGKPLCQSTPCSKEVAPGVHRVAMVKENYVPREETMTIRDVGKIAWELTADYAIYSFSTAPEGVMLVLDGKEIGKSPIKEYRISPGGHELSVKDPCYFGLKKTFSVERGKNQTINLDLDSRPAGVEVSVVDAKGNALGADIFVDGNKVGRAPDTFTVPVCSKEIEARPKDFPASSRPLELKEKETLQVVLKVQNFYQEGQRYYYGKGVTQSFEKAAELFAKSCDAGTMRGCSELGVSYEDGEGVPQSDTNAVELYIKACRGGYMRGCSNLAFMYERGAGLAKSEEKASQLFEKACTGGYLGGCSSLGVSYEYGKGVPKSHEKATEFYRKACNEGYMRGCSNLGYMHERGKGLTQSHEKAAKLYERGCIGGHMRGCSNLAVLYEKGQGVPQSHGKAAQLYEKACAGGYMRGCSNLGVLYETGEGVGQSHEKAVELYKTACAAGYARGCANLGVMYEKGTGVPLSHEKARELYRKACKDGFKKACEWSN